MAGDIHSAAGALNGESNADLPTRLEEILQRKHAELLLRMEMLFAKQQAILNAPCNVVDLGSIHGPLTTISGEPQASRSCGGNPEASLMTQSTDGLGDASEGVRSFVDTEAAYQMAVRASTDCQADRVTTCHEKEKKRLTGVVWLVQHWKFEAFFAFIIATNSVLIGIQVEWSSLHINEPTPASFALVGMGYAFIFLIELLIRIAAEGRTYFYRSENLKWNYVDLFIVVSSIAETCLLLPTLVATEENVGVASSSNFRLLRVIRVTRMVRIVRIIKLIRFIRALKSLVHSILSTLKSLMWSLVLLIILVYIFGIIFTDAVTSHRADQLLFGDYQGSHANDVLNQRFGTLHRSMHTLFRSISDGLDWDTAADSLTTVHWVWVYIFSAYISFSCFAVLNVMTGVFCQGAIDGAARDHELQVQSMLIDKKHNIDLMMKLFSQIDNSGVGVITLVEFEQKFDQPDVVAFLNSLALEPSDAWTLFRLLDQEGKGAVELDDFIEGCMRLKGPAKAMDVALLHSESKSARKRAKKIETNVLNISKQLSVIRNEVQFMTQTAAIRQPQAVVRPPAAFSQSAPVSPAAFHEEDKRSPQDGDQRVLV